jgi:nitroreductase
MMTREMPAPQPPDKDWSELVLALITSRYSVAPKRLAAPGPSTAQLQAIVEAAGCAPDHELLRPWRLVRIAPDQRERLAALFVQALLERDPQAAADDQARAREKAFRAPDLLLAIARLEPAHGDVPAHERYVALGAALMNALLAAHGMGFGAMLTSGHSLRTRRFAQAFACQPGEVPVCFVSIGTPVNVRRRARPSAQELMSHWPPDGGDA